MGRKIVVAVVVGVALFGTSGRAQEDTHLLQLADRGPSFFSIVEPGGTVVDARNASVLKRTLALNLDRAPLPAALEAVERAAGVHIVYAPDVLPNDMRVSIQASRITLLAALDDVLQDAQLDVKIAPSGILTLVPRSPVASASTGRPARQQGTAALTGHVVDGALHTPLSEVSVRIDGTTFAATTDAAGKYTITGVTPGTYRATARRVGYQALTKDITLNAGQSVTLDFPLTAAPTRLDEVVTTAVGDQRRYEVGNDISRINADSIAPTAPITSLTDLISARAPGVTVLENSGLTGSGEAIRIEGLTSLELQNDPILIVDGVRQDNSAGGDIALYGGGGSHPSPTRLNDIDYSDIETIDILKGPAASTEYGTDAANGVIVITTKHGTAGAPKWKVSAEQTESDIPESFPAEYHNWGHTTDGTNTVVPSPYDGCALSVAYPQYGEYASTAGNCVVDSVTEWNPLNHSQTSVFTTGDRRKYDLSVSGGSETLRYFVAGGLSNETGVIQAPPVFKELADTSGLAFPSAALGPNTEQQRSARVNTSIRLGPTADLSANVSYLATYQQTPSADNLYGGVIGASPEVDAPGYNYGYGPAYYTPLAQLSAIGSQNTNRLTGGFTATWHPTGWFVGYGTGGVDHGSQTDETLNYPLANSAYQGLSSSLAITNIVTDVYSVDIRGTATASIARAIRAATSAGLQIVDTREAGQSAFSQSINLTNLTLNGATSPRVSQIGTRAATLGGYGEEQLSIADRLYLTGAMRVDGASGFGSMYSVAAYPKASLSWLALSSGPTMVRVRGAFGESGVQPQNGAALQLYQVTTAAVGSGGSLVGASELASPGNPNLRPERTAEFEGGVDVGAWGNRVSLALTGYEKTTHDALVDENLGATLGNLIAQENIGEVRNTGLEGTVTVGVVQTQAVTWDVAVNASVNHNDLLTLAPGVTANTIEAGGDYNYRQEVGYPLYGLWALPIKYADVNRDGIIEQSEVTVGDSVEYVGPSLPTQEISVSTHLGFLRGAVAIGALADYRGGYKILNGAGQTGDGVSNTLGTTSPTAPLRLQARAIENEVNPGNLSALDMEDGSFIRLREVSLTYVVPALMVRTLRMHALSLTAAVRNVALWTRYTGSDPEVTNSEGGGLQSGITQRSLGVVNNDVRADFGAVPLARYWVVRLNVGL